MAIYTTVREKLESIQKSKKESDIFPTLQMLFQTKGFSNVEITHGNSEMGKDLVFKHYDSMLGRETWFALVVKNKNAGQEVFEEGGEITRQIKLAFEVPYKDAKAEEHYINTVIVIINGSVSAQAKTILAFIGQYMHVRGMREIDIPQLSGFLQEIYDKFSYDELTDIQGFIEKLKNRNCLFIYNETSNTFCFNNLSFQEYFASIFYDDSNEQELVDNIYNDWWANVIVFYNGKSPKRSVFIEKILTSRVPTDTSTMYRHLQIVSKCVQAAHLISNDVEKRTIENLINTFDSFYKCTILPAIENPANAGLLRSLSTLDMILQARNIFCQIFQSKHINQEIFSSVGMDILLKSTFGYSDVTLYCLSYHLSDITNDGMFLQYFIGKKLNTRWDRIVYKDIDHMRLKAMLSPNIYNRIKRKQRQNKIYIDKQFKEPAILHLSDGLKV